MGKYAYLNPLEHDAHPVHDVAEHNLDEWVRRHSNSGDMATTTVPTLLQPTATPDVSSLSLDDDPVSPDADAADPSEADLNIERDAPTYLATTESKLAGLGSRDEDPANVVSEEKISASSTIETVVSLHPSMQLVRLCVVLTTEQSRERERIRIS